MMQFITTRSCKNIRFLFLLVFGGILLFSTACAPILNPGEPPVSIHFMPHFSVMDAGNEKTRKLQVTVATPMAPAELNNDSIALLINGREYRRLAGYRWVGTVPELIQRSLIAGLDSSRAFASVSAAGAGIRPNVRILCDISQFAFDYPEGGSPSIDVRMTLKAIDFSSGVVLGSLPVERRVPARSSKVDDMAAVAETVTADIVRDVNNWLITLF